MRNRQGCKKQAPPRLHSNPSQLTACETNAFVEYFFVQAEIHVPIAEPGGLEMVSWPRGAGEVRQAGHAHKRHDQPEERPVCQQ